MKLKSKDNAFFMPIIMVYIFLFTSLISYSIFQVVGYQYLVIGFEQKMYGELAMEKSERMISKFIEKNKNYDKICSKLEKGKIDNYKTGNYEYLIKYSCLKLPDDILLGVKLKELRKDEIIDEVLDVIEEVVLEDYYLFNVEIKVGSQKQEKKIYYNKTKDKINWIAYS